MDNGLLTSRVLMSVAISFFLVLALFYVVLIPGEHIGSVSLHTEQIFAHLAPPKTTHVSYKDAIRAIYHPLIKSITNESFTDPTDGAVYRIERPPTDWTYSLGKQFCIVDIDTRPLDESTQLFSNGPFNWEGIEGVSSGMPNHYIYSAIHGYDYKFIHTTEWPNNERDNVWTKVPALRDLLKSYRLVLMIDADAIIRHLDLPFEWLLNRWNFTMDTSMAMPYDVDLGFTKNKFGDLNPNAGVVLAQNLPRTFEMLDAWVGCPDNIEECDGFRHGWPAEQGAFGEIIRYRYNRTSDFMFLSCDDAMGFPSQGTECKGRFVRHFTTSKGEIKQATGDALLQTIMARTQMEMLGGFDHEGVTVMKDTSEIIQKEYPEPEG